MYVLWRVALPGLTEINTKLPMLFGSISVVFVLALLLGIAFLILILMGFPIIRTFYLWAWQAINILYPFAIGLGKIFYIPKEKIQQSFIEVSNKLVRCRKLRIAADRILVLTPHCLQLDTCNFKITRNIENCKRCGRCSIGPLLELTHRYGAHLAVATGGTLARQLVMELRPKAIVAVACERDLTSGIQDVFPLPVLGVLNERPFGPCFNTRVDLKKVENAILAFCDGEIKNEA